MQKLRLFFKNQTLNLAFQSNEERDKFENSEIM